ncbi:MAG: MFS transporter [Bryobacteraceae bacterium]|jgi:DHA2 family multidrug resistance protein
MSNETNSKVDRPATARIVVGILAVLLGGLLSTLNGRLLSVELPDLRGALSLSVEQAAWVSTTFSMGLMFMGVFTVYFGALLGVRRILLAASGVYMAATFLLPFAASYTAMIALQAIAGLSAGTFYPLTLSFILTALPIRVAHWGLAAYSLSILFGVNIASQTAAWLNEQHSWPWIFWLLSATSFVMLLCVWAGVPRTPLPKANREIHISWRGLLYWSAGLALLYGALDMGERVHWFDSPAFAASLAAAAFLLAASIFRRKQDPNPLLTLPFLRDRSTILLSGVLFAFRFFVLGTALIIPQFLAGVGGFRNEQVGPVLAITALLQFALAWIVAATLRDLDVRILLALGFAVIGVTAYFCSRLDSGWSPATFVLPAVFFAVGESMAMLGLVAGTILQLLSTGAIAPSGKPERPFDALTFSSFFHTVRIIGGQVGSVLMLHVITERTKYHVAILGSQTEPFRPAVGGFLRGVAGLDAAAGAAPAHAAGFAGYSLGAAVQRQAATLAFADAFTVLSRGTVGVLLCIAFVRLRYSRLEEVE